MVNWSVPARNDLKNIYDYISQDSSYYATRVIENIIERSEQINFHPRSGRIVPEIADKNTRELIVYSYRLIYEIKNGDAFVLAVIHSARNLKAKQIKKIRNR